MNDPNANSLIIVQHRLMWMIAVGTIALLLPIALLVSYVLDSHHVELRSHIFHLGTTAIAQDAMLDIDKLISIQDKTEIVQSDYNATSRQEKALLNALTQDLVQITQLQQCYRWDETETLLVRLAQSSEAMGALAPKDTAKRISHLERTKHFLNQIRLLHENAHLDLARLMEKRRLTLVWKIAPLAFILACGGGTLFFLLWQAIRFALVRESNLGEQIRASEAQLRASTERYVLVEQAVNDGIWDWDLDSEEVFFSRQFKELLGYGENEFGKDMDALMNLVHLEDMAMMKETIQSHLSRTVSCDVTCRLQTKSDQWRWFRFRSEALRNTDGSARRIAGSISDITPQKSAEDELVTAAMTDNLTGLPNRALLLDRLRMIMARNQRNETPYAVMFLDFDRFKVINDSLGHDIGDEVLKQISQRLLGQIRAVDSVARFVSSNTAARFGGDEFVVLLDNIERPQDVIAFAERMLKKFADPYQLGQHEVRSTASIGIVIGDASYCRAEDVLRDADTAMYEAKQTGKARYVIFDGEMRDRVQGRAQLENDLHQAIGTDQWLLAYQPIVSLNSGEVEGFEALLRWQHPQHGLLGPDEFISVAEETGMIVSVGNWVLDEACRQLAQWRQSLGADAPPCIHVNMSRKQLLLPNLVRIVEQTLERHAISPECLHLEVTESVIMDNPKTAATTLGELRELGVKIDIDDFGTGYSSLSCLHEYPINVLKIDRSFIANIERVRDFAALLHATLTLADNLGLQVVAEGIENAEQLILLQSLGCEYGQGYFFAKPMFADEVENFVGSKVKPTLTLSEAK